MCASVDGSARRKRDLVAELQTAIRTGALCDVPDTSPPRKNDMMRAGRRSANLVWARSTVRLHAATTAAEVRSQGLDEPMRKYLQGITDVWRARIEGSFKHPTPATFVMMFITGATAMKCVHHTNDNIATHNAALSGDTPPLERLSMGEFGNFLRAWMLACLFKGTLQFVAEQSPRWVAMPAARFRQLLQVFVGFNIPADGPGSATFHERRDLSPLMTSLQRHVAYTNIPLLVGNCRDMLLSLDDDLFR